VLLAPGGGGALHTRGLLIVAASFSWALGTVLASRGGLPAAPAVASTVEMAAGGAAMLALGFLSGERLHVTRVTESGWLALAYLVVFGSLIAFRAYSWLLGVAPVSRVATYAYVNPLVAVILGGVFLHEHLTLAILGGGALVVLAVVVVVRSEHPEEPTEA